MTEHFCDAFVDILLYTHLPYHNDSIIKTHAERRKRKTQEETMQDKDAGRLLFKYIHLSLYCKGSKGLFKVCMWEGDGRPNINFLFWPHCYDHHVVPFLFSWCWGQLHRGFPRAPSVGCGLPYHIWSLAVWNSTGNCFCTPNSTELNNNPTPTRSPTGSLKSDV